MSEQAEDPISANGLVPVRSEGLRSRRADGVVPGSLKPTDSRPGRTSISV